MDQIDDGELFFKIRNDDLNAFNDLYTLLAPVLYERVFRLLKNPETVEEILQDVFMKIWKIRHDIVPDKGFKTYIYRMADNLAIDHLRKISREKDLQAQFWADSLTFPLHLEECDQKEEQYSMLNEAIQLLPPRRKEILLLCNIERKSYKEVAHTLGISVSTVSNQLASAMKDIKKYISIYYKNECILALALFFSLL